MIAGFPIAGKGGSLRLILSFLQIPQSGHNPSLVAPDCAPNNSDIASSGWHPG
jgi:hypothetical protein